MSNSLFRLLVPSEEQEDPESVLVNLAPPVKHDAAYTQPSAPSVSASSGTTAWMETPAAPHVHAQPAAAHPVVHQQPHLHEESAAASAHALNAAAVEALLEDDVEVDVPAPVPAAPVVAAPVVAAPPAVPTDPFKKLNYSDIVKKAQGGAAAATAPTAATPVSAPRAAPAQPAAAAPVQTTSSASFTAGFSVYVKQVPEAASEADLRAVFAPFGTVTAVDVQVGRSFAFVKFDSHAAVVAAVTSASANPLVVHGATLRVEERNSSRGGGSSSGATAGGASGSGNHGGRDGAGRSRGERGGRDGRDGRDGQRDGRDRQQGGGGGGGDRNRGGDRDRDGSRQGASKGSSGGRSGSSGNTKAN